jgi:probable rRNA maturation factor
MNKINIFNETGIEVSELEIIEKLLDYAIEYEELDNLEFNVIIVDNEKIHELNKEFRGIDRPTDVITFALEDNEDFPKLETRILGDIYISLEKAKGQAIEYGHGFLRELSFLAIHGFLHLLGYDHIKDSDKVIMRKAEEDIMTKVKLERE